MVVKVMVVVVPPVVQIDVPVDVTVLKLVALDEGVETSMVSVTVVAIGVLRLVAVDEEVETSMVSVTVVA